jgi:RNA polymerase sigma-70 factor (ECF subfamily)
LDFNVEAFEELYRTQGRRMKSLAFNMLGSVADAEDAVQEAFLRAYRSWPEFRGQAALSTWTYRILFNACYDIGRLRGKRREEAWEDHPAADPPAPSHDHPLRATLERAIGRLKPRQREVFLLFEVEGFKHGEIAEILQIPEGTSKAALFDARRELRELIKATPAPGAAS